MYDAIFLMGPQGSGKGTQAKILAEKLGFFHWEMGRVLRGERDHRFSSGQAVGEIIDTGILLDDDQLLEIFKKRVDQIPEGQGVIFDGIPRRIGQAEYVLKYLQEAGRQNVVTIFLNLPREESIDRLLARAKTEKREDDTREGIETRLRYYEENTLPMLEFMKQHVRFIELDGTPPIPEVTKAIDQALGIA